MKKTLLGIAMLLTMCLATQASPVDTALTRRAALAFWNTYRTAGTKAITAADLTPVVYEGISHLHIYDVLGTGFVVMAADNSVRPVLAYSFDQPMPATPGPALRQWLESYDLQIAAATRMGYTAIPRTADEWLSLESGEVPEEPLSLLNVPAMLTTLWDQTDPYNRLCPYDSIDHARAVVGCTATAMAQIMKYWNHPTFGTGQHTYLHENWHNGQLRSYGNLSVDFSQTTYHWDEMIDAVDLTARPREINAIATLSYHCGVAVEMQYGTSNMGGSGAWTIAAGSYGNHPACAEYAFRDYFKYDSSLYGVKRNNYTDSVWRSKIDNDLALERPILYTGDGAGAGHAFVLDGADNSGRYHFNWGWSGMGNGYFVIDSLNPLESGTGGNSSNSYNLNQTAIFSLFPREEQLVDFERTDTICNTSADYQVYDYTLPATEGTYHLQHLDTTLTLHLVVQTKRYAYFTPNGAEGDRISRVFCPVDGIVMPECTFTNGDLLFRGWCSQRDLSDSIYRPGQVAHYNHNVVFYAIWRDSAEAAGIATALAPTPTLYPNPATTTLTVDPGTDADATVTLFDALGRTLQRHQTALGRTLQIGLDGLTSGIYTLQVRTADGIHNSRVIKQ